mmetsp:Transcript_35230/g.88073  ORF Transcript_35230/g.88073 Transcript_35230/m.88073 type:complete len:329 (-) Transcript_35230:215-1201(-)
MREKRRPLRWGGQDAPSVLAASISTPKQKANRIQNASWEVAEEDKDATADAYEGADVEENETAPSVMASVAAPKKPKVRVVSRNVKCVHGKRKSQCILGCGGSEMCEHGKRRAYCKFEGCGGTGNCIHGRQKARCTICCGECIHGKHKQTCREVGCIKAPVKKCVHGKSKARCTEGCGGSAMCKHGKGKADCTLGCSGSALCIHGRRKSYCTQGCGGSSMCMHGRRKAECAIAGCGGSAMCVHGIRLTKCRQGCSRAGLAARKQGEQKVGPKGEQKVRKLYFLNHTPKPPSTASSSDLVVLSPGSDGEEVDIQDGSRLMLCNQICMSI